MQNYAKGKPVGNNQVPFYDSPPPATAISAFGRDNGVASSILILDANTTAIEVAATAGLTYVKWLSQSVVDSSVAGTSVIGVGATANFDHVIPSGVVKRLVVPIETGASQENIQVGLNTQNGLYKNVAIKTGTISSVATSQH